VSKYPAQRQEITTEKKKRARIRKVIHLIKNTSQSSQPADVKDAHGSTAAAAVPGRAKLHRHLLISR
jgi:hypothetical protein